MASLTDTSDRSKADFFLFLIEVYLEVWGSKDFAQEVRFLFNCCSKEVFFFHVTTADHVTLDGKGEKNKRKWSANSGLLKL